MAFDRPLLPGLLDPTNWRVRVGNLRRLGVAPCTAAGNTVVCPIGGGILNAGPDIADYLPPPFDVTNKDDTGPAAAFVNFPLTVLP